MEIWKPIEGYIGLYEVSDAGNIRSVQTNKVLKPQHNKRTSYSYLTLTKDGKRSPSLAIHRLIARAFLGIPPGGMEVGHKNEVKTDNRAENLCYLTHQQNAKAWFAMKQRNVKRRKNGVFYSFDGTKPTAAADRAPQHNAGAKHPRAKLTDDQVLEMRVLHKQGWGARRLAKKFGVAQSRCTDICNRKSWTHI
jgi:hypothetical protein